jgi:hypothetical protein
MNRYRSSKHPRHRPAQVSGAEVPRGGDSSSTQNSALPTAMLGECLVEIISPAEAVHLMAAAVQEDPPSTDPDVLRAATRAADTTANPRRVGARRRIAQVFPLTVRDRPWTRAGRAVPPFWRLA